MNSSISNRFFNDFVYGITHDLGASIRHVSSFSELIHNRCADKLNESEKTWLCHMTNGSRKSKDILEALSSLSSFISATEKEENCKVSLKFTLEKVLNKLSTDIENTQAECIVLGEWSEVWGIERQWYTLLSCLIENSILHGSSDNNGLVIKISCESNDENIIVNVEDNGHGVMENQYVNIVKPFKKVKLHSNETRIGMGLTYCALISEVNSASLLFSKSALGGLKVSYIHPLNSGDS